MVLYVGEVVNRGMGTQTVAREAASGVQQQNDL